MRRALRQCFCPRGIQERGEEEEEEEVEEVVVVDEEEEKERERGLLIHCAKENPWEMRRGERVRRENGVNEIIAKEGERAAV